MFRNVHPTMSPGDTGPIRSNAVKTGRNFDNTAYADDRYIRCKQCGFMCHLDRDMKAPDGSRVGDGVAQADTNLSKVVAIDDTTISVDSTTGFASSGSAYIYETNSTEVSSGDNKMMPFVYTGVTDTTFTGVTGVITAFAIDDVVRGEVTAKGGCPQCGSLNYE